MASKKMVADGYVTPAGVGAGETKKLKALIATGKGVTAGDKVAIRHGSPTGEVAFEGVFDSANGQAGASIPHPGIEVELPIYYTEQKTGGAIKAFVVWD